MKRLGICEYLDVDGVVHRRFSDEGRFVVWERQRGSEHFYPVPDKERVQLEARYLKVQKG